MSRDIALLVVIVLAVAFLVVITAEHRVNGLAMPLLVDKTRSIS